MSLGQLMACGSEKWTAEGSLKMLIELIKVLIDVKWYYKKTRLMCNIYKVGRYFSERTSQKAEIL